MWVFANKFMKRPCERYRNRTCDFFLVREDLIVKSYNRLEAKEKYEICSKHCVESP